MTSNGMLNSILVMRQAHENAFGLTLSCSLRRWSLVGAKVVTTVSYIANARLLRIELRHCCRGREHDEASINALSD
eukprot:272347-Pleurochrysis_carterae.AAC.1